MDAISGAAARGLIERQDAAGTARCSGSKAPRGLARRRRAGARTGAGDAVPSAAATATVAARLLPPQLPGGRRRLRTVRRSKPDSGWAG